MCGRLLDLSSVGIAQGLHDALNVISRKHELDTVVLSGGVFQNELLLEDLKSLLANGVGERIAASVDQPCGATE